MQLCKNYVNLKYCIGQKFNVIVIKTALGRSNLLNTLVSQEIFASIGLGKNLFWNSQNFQSEQSEPKSMIRDIEGLSNVKVINRLLWRTGLTVQYMYRSTNKTKKSLSRMYHSGTSQFWYFSSQIEFCSCAYKVDVIFI